MLTLKEWLAKYGQESCGGCFYNNAVRCHCSYKGRYYCARYEQYVKDSRRDDEPIKPLFADETLVKSKKTSK